MFLRPPSPSAVQTAPGTTWRSAGLLSRCALRAPHRTGLRVPAALAMLGCVRVLMRPFPAPLYYCGCGCLVPWFLGGFGGVCANLTQAQMQAHGPKKTAQKAKGHACNSKKGTALSGYCCVAVENPGCETVPGRRIPAARNFRVAESQLPQTSGINPAFKPGVLGCAWGCVQKTPAMVGGWVGVVVAVLLEGPAN